MVAKRFTLDKTTPWCYDPPNISRFLICHCRLYILSFIWPFRRACIYKEVINLFTVKTKYKNQAHVWKTLLLAKRLITDVGKLLKLLLISPHLSLFQRCVLRCKNCKTSKMADQLRLLVTLLWSNCQVEIVLDMCLVLCNRRFYWYCKCIFCHVCPMKCNQL